MNLWIDVARDELLDIIGRVDCLVLNDEELRQLTSKPNLISAAHEVLQWGPSMVVAKQGEYGSALITADDFFALPAYPLHEVIDPTGAGDTFAGGFVGFIARHIDQAHDPEVLRNAMAYGTSLASFNVEQFGTEGLQHVDPAAVRARVDDLWRFARFERIEVALID
jgi:sugar/nucleoside kinase (ribokinase family)